MAPSINWRELGFSYMDTGAYVTVEYRDGKWGDIVTRTEAHLPLHVAAGCLHYGQACFEGMKAFGRKDGSTAIFRPEKNARRLIDSAERLVMKAPPEELFVEAVKKVVELNREYVPPYGTGASLYIRPLLIGITPRIGIQPSTEFLFVVLAMPVGPYYKDGFFPVKALIQEEFDRAAPHGVGHVKAAGNYGASLYADMDGKKKGFPICLYLDSATHKFIDEFGTSNFVGITPKGNYVTPESGSILPSITNESLQEIARDFGLSVVRRPIPVEELDSFKEVGACGTAAVITPIYSINRGEKEYTFGEEGKAGETLTRLFNEIQGIQFGEIEDRHGWMVQV